jgi:hypothetical protein
MAGDELVRCRCCGEMFVAPRPERGPRASYCSPACRQRAYRDRLHLEVATEAADLALVSTHGMLTLAVAALPPSSALMLRDLLRDASDRNLSPAGRDELCRSDATPVGCVVAGLHTKEL